jgi:hypothetical protein
MASIREQILEQLCAAWDADRPEHIPAVDRDRLRPYEGATLPRVNLGIAPLTGPQETVERVHGRGGALVQRSLRIGVECYAAGNTTTCLDPLLVWATSALVSDTPQGLFLSCEEEAIQWAAEDLDASYRKATMILRVLYTTQKKDQTRKV